MEKTRISRKAVKINRRNLKNGFTEDRNIHEKVKDINKTNRDFYLPVVKLLSDMIDKNLK